MQCTTYCKMLSAGTDPCVVQLTLWNANVMFSKLETWNFSKVHLSHLLTFSSSLKDVRLVVVCSSIYQRFVFVLWST